MASHEPGREPDDPNEAHVVDLARLADHWGEVVNVDGAEGVQLFRAECRCDWRGPLRYVIAIARGDGEVHASGSFQGWGDPSSSDDSSRGAS